jgi:hypothetical protein
MFALGLARFFKAKGTALARARRFAAGQWHYITSSWVLEPACVPMLRSAATPLRGG